MGLFRNSYFWAGVLNSIEFVAADRDFPEAQAEALSEIGCNAFGQLLDDPELSEDLAHVQSLSEDADPEKLAGDVSAFRRFLYIEERIFQEAGAGERTAQKLMRRLHDLRVSPPDDNFQPEEFLEQLAQLRSVFCAGGEALTEFEQSSPEKPKRRSRWEVTKKTTSGVFVMSANLGSATAAGIAFPPSGVAAGLAAAYSVEFGRKLWMQAWRGRW